VSPRKSFAAWKQLVKGQSLPWRPPDLAAALELRRVVIRALLRHTEAELIRVSNADPLTGLANRRVLQQRMGRWLSGDPPGSAALLFCDLDRFKTVNDSLGHHAGDQLLHEVAGRLMNLVDPNHLLVRLGGDEFVIFCENISEANALTLARNVLRVFETPFSVDGQPYRTSTSVGIAFTDSGSDDLLREADAAMYEAKRQGANCAVVFQNGMHKKVMNTLRTEQDLFLAIERNELQVHYQPIVTLPEGRLTGFEALARWLHPVRGWVSPTDFIPLAEQTGLICEIGMFVAARAIAELAALPDTSLHMAINVSAHQLRQPRFTGQLTALCAQHGLAPSRLILEVTESTLMQDDAVMEIAAVRALGCRVAIDDFGTGYSSLASMRRLPVNIIKIDRSFTSPLGRDASAEPFLQAIMRLVETLNLQVIAEGVETAEQCEVLQALGCRYAQGYLFGKPQPMAGFAWRDRPAEPAPKKRKVQRARAPASAD
jgi:diguanylate cyclase (GGDEF)-like protein